MMRRMHRVLGLSVLVLGLLVTPAAASTGGSTGTPPQPAPAPSARSVGDHVDDSCAPHTVHAPSRT